MDSWTDIIHIWREFWPHLVAFAAILLSTLASGHAILNKRDSRAAFTWVGVIWLSPFLGTLLYYIFGINRIHRRALKLRGDHAPPIQTPSESTLSVALLDRLTPEESKHLGALLSFGDKMVGIAAIGGNRITPFQNGDAAYPQMLEAIAKAKSSIALSSYIFNRDTAGIRFVKALEEAGARGVEIRVLVDAVGSRYSLPTILGLLKKAKIRSARFLPTFFPWTVAYMNLRSHRKFLIIDGKIAFTGGMNISVGNLLKENPPYQIQDLHFLVEGPIVEHIQRTFVDDWSFTTHENLRGPAWFPKLPPAGNAQVRALPDGPGQHFEKIHWAFQGAILNAQERIRIITPYFLPERSILNFLIVAATSGIQVQLILPEKNNLRFVEWACMSSLDELLDGGVEVYLTPPPFDHSKLMIVDRAYCSFGSANWDARSLRLNFEFNLECFDVDVTNQMHTIFDEKLSTARVLKSSDLAKLSFPLKLRNAIARLFTPYL